MLKADYYGVREVKLGGAPMSRETWIERHPEPAHEVKSWTVVADDGTKIPHVMCFTCWTLGLERLKYEEPVAVAPGPPAPPKARAK